MGEFNRDNSATIANLVDQLRDERAEVERLNGESNALALRLHMCGNLLKRADSIIRAVSGWPVGHPNDVTEWMESWQKLEPEIYTKYYIDYGNLLAQNIRLQSDARLGELQDEIKRLEAKNKRLLERAKGYLLNHYGETLGGQLFQDWLEESEG
jgi:hypothetical protein